jgi:hypothetical protein
MRQHGPEFVKWLHDHKILKRSFSILARALRIQLEQTVNTEADVKAIWTATPAVLSRCNEQSTYELAGAPSAYAWLHLLDRYARTWAALEKLTLAGYLPLGKHGVRALDIGTGPGPSAFAVNDFYNTLSRYGNENRVGELRQDIDVSCVEFDAGTNHFRHQLAEIVFQLTNDKSILSLCGGRSDFGDLVPRKERFALQRSLRWQEEAYYDETLDDWNSDLVHTPEEANDQAQSLHRYRLITFSNFLTTGGIVRRFELNISEILEDSHPGTVVLLIGGKGASYPEIYKYVNNLAIASGFQLKVRDVVSSDATEVSGCPFAEGAKLYSRFQALAFDSSDCTEAARQLYGSKPKAAPSSQIWAYRKFRWRKSSGAALVRRTVQVG